MREGVGAGVRVSGTDATGRGGWRHRLADAVPAALAVVVGLLGTAAAQAETVIRTVSFEYHATTGLLTKETVEPDDANYRVITTYTYDDFGNRLTSTSSGVGVANRTTTHTYDANGRFALTTTNTLGHTETRTYDPKFGQVLTQTGPNGLTTTNQYDKWGRLTQTTAPDGAVEQRTYALLTEGMETCITSSAAPQRCEVSDRLGRLSYVKRPSFHSGVHVLESRTLYDRAGRPYLQLRPGEGMTMFSGHSGGTASFYDLSGRVVEVRDVDSEVTSGTSSPLAAIGNPCNAPSCLKTTYTYGYDVGTRQTWVQSTDPKGNQEKRYSDFAGRLVKVTDALNNSTTYAYNATGQLTQTTDPLGNKITTAYNKRGEKSSTTDPDMGTWTYEYTVYGELWRQTDAKAQVTTMVYDALGRLIQRSEPEMVSYWRYDTYQDSSPCPKGIGKLCSAWVSHGYERKHIYDAYGRSSTVQIKVDGNWYDTSYTYDGNGRLATLTYPNGFAVTYAYTASNHPWKVVRNDTGSTIYEVVSDRYAPTVGSFREYKAVYGDGFQEQRLWDKHGRPTTTTYRSPSN
ncbi:MAG: RHS repeat protein, partial [Gemmatimonadales bacterium]|nr:RHS repeat protein [Gemmatimonadales bacterium]